jgi:RNA polymerase sigma factor (sigma-70 family)
MASNIDLDIYRTLAIRQRMLLKSWLKEIFKSDYGVSEPTILNAVSLNQFQAIQAPLSDQAIIQGIRTKDNEIFRYLRNITFPTIKWYVDRNKGNIDDAEDVFSAAIIQLIMIVDRNKLVIQTSIVAYLIALAKNEWAKKNRNKPLLPDDPNQPIKSNKTIVPLIPKKPNKPKGQNRPTIIFQENVEEKEDEEEVNDQYPEDFEVINRCFEYIAEKCQKLLTERYLNKKDWDQVAVKLGYPSAASARQKHLSCTQKFKEDIEKGKILKNKEFINPKYLTKIRACKFLNISGKELSLLQESGKIKSVTVNGQTRFTKDELNLYIRNWTADLAICNKRFIKLDLLKQTYFPFECMTFYPIFRQTRSWIYLYNEGWGNVKLSKKEFNKYFSIADEVQKFAFKCNIFI